MHDHDYYNDLAREERSYQKEQQARRVHALFMNDPKRRMAYRKAYIEPAPPVDRDDVPLDSPVY
jgi:hypothetical protein